MSVCHVIWTLLWLAGCGDSYLVGRAITDITGLASEGDLYGYGSTADTRGLHTRQFARTFIFADDEDSERVVFCTADIWSPTQALRDEIVDKLVEEYGSLYTHDNVMITPTHSHSSPGGHNEYWMYQLPSGGIVRPTYDAYADGIFRSIQLAHEDLQPATVTLNSGELDGAMISRSPYSYDQNPEDEQGRYEHNVDKTMTVLKVVSEEGEDMGMLSFFPIHTTSLKSSNRLVSGDNKGVATNLWERYYNDAPPGQGSIVGLIAQTTEGDVTPNVRGDLCDNTFEPCFYNTSTCPENPNNPQLCKSYGLTGDMWVDCAQAGIDQFNRARELFDEEGTEIFGPVGFRHTYVNISDVVVGQDDEGNDLTTCRPALGYSFAAGATDGPGGAPFTQGELEGIPAVDEVIDTVFGRSEEMKACQAPKPVLLPAGEIEFPWPWAPEIIPFQLFRVGPVIFIGSPAEMTTMTGRRIGDKVKEAFAAEGIEGLTTLTLAMANSFTGYVTTYEEYSVQRYEGGHTLYGPHTLAAYELIFSDLASALASGEDVDPGEEPLDLRDYPGDALDDLLMDFPLDGTDFGDCVEEPDELYEQGEEASAVFVSANPRNNLRHGDTYLAVQELIDDADWVTRYYDADHETRFFWSSSCHGVTLPGPAGCNERQQSNATIAWQIPVDQQPGIYRLAVYGDANIDPDADPVSFSGASQAFSVVESTTSRVHWRSRGLHTKLGEWEFGF